MEKGRNLAAEKEEKKDRPSETVDLKMTPLTDEPVTSSKKGRRKCFFLLSLFFLVARSQRHIPHVPKNVFRAFYFSFSDLCYTKEGGDLASCWTCCSIPLLHNKTQEGKKERGALIPGFFSPPLLSSLSSFLNFFLKNFFCWWSSRRRRKGEGENLQHVEFTY